MVSRSDLQRLEVEIESLRESLRWLTERVYALEQTAGQVVQRRPVAATAPPAPVVERAPEPATVPAPGPGWEAILGGNWLNKVGVLVLVIGLALFLWYSFGQMGPAGRVTLSIVREPADDGGRRPPGAQREVQDRGPRTDRGRMGGVVLDHIRGPRRGGRPGDREPDCSDAAAGRRGGGDDPAFAALQVPDRFRPLVLCGLRDAGHQPAHLLRRVCADATGCLPPIPGPPFSLVHGGAGRYAGDLRHLHAPCGALGRGQSRRGCSRFFSCTGWYSNYSTYSTPGCQDAGP